MEINQTLCSVETAADQIPSPYAGELGGAEGDVLVRGASSPAQAKVRLTGKALVGMPTPRSKPQTDRRPLAAPVRKLAKELAAAANGRRRCDQPMCGPLLEAAVEWPVHGVHAVLKNDVEPTRDSDRKASVEVFAPNCAVTVQPWRRPRLITC